MKKFKPWEHPEMTGNASFSECGRYRYLLTRSWDPGAGDIHFICLNPSTATASTNDPTVRRLIDFAYRWGFGSMQLTNLFGLRSTDPSYLYSGIYPVGDRNDEFISRAYEFCDMTVLAWGNHGRYRSRSKEVRQICPAAFCLGKTKEGEPKHPLYLRKDTERILMV